MPALPVDVSRTIEDLLTILPLDICHVHEPFAPSTSSAALRHSRALNVGTFHTPTERLLSTQVARKVVQLVLGRLDARTASYEATRELMQRFFPAEYRVLLPGADPPRPRADRRADAPDADPLRRRRGARRAAALPARAPPAGPRHGVGGDDRLRARAVEQHAAARRPRQARDAT